MTLKTLRETLFLSNETAPIKTLCSGWKMFFMTFLSLLASFMDGFSGKLCSITQQQVMFTNNCMPCVLTKISSGTGA